MVYRQRVAVAAVLEACAHALIKIQESRERLGERGGVPTKDMMVQPVGWIRVGRSQVCDE